MTGACAAAFGRGALAAAVAAIAAPLGGLVVAELTGTGHIAVYAVLLASGSAAIVLPTLQERRLDGPEAMVVIAQVTVADVASILAVPLVLQPSRAADAAVGGLLVAACALVVFLVARSLRPRPWVHRLRKRSKRRGWALDLRLSLAVLFGLAWIAQQSGTSVLLGGFAMGLVVAAIGGPKRLSTQVRGIAEGFFVPLFFVVLGARLDVSALVDHPDLLLVTGSLIVLNSSIHALAALATRQPPAAGLIATAQLGVPAAVVQIGLQEHVISPALGAAVTIAALATLALCALGTDRLARRPQPVATDGVTRLREHAALGHVDEDEGHRVRGSVAPGVEQVEGVEAGQDPEPVGGLLRREVRRGAGPAGPVAGRGASCPSPAAARSAAWRRRRRPGRARPSRRARGRRRGGRRRCARRR